jgi:class 3 adenylate cyclase
MKPPVGWHYRAVRDAGRHGRPSGTVTFLFTDIEGSTRPWEADPKTIKAALAAHDEVLLSAVEGSGGWLFTHTGDVVCAAFSAAGDAVAAAIHARRSLELPVRMGIAMGEAELRGDDYFGPALNRAVRVMGVGHGRQVLVSGSTAGLVAGVSCASSGGGGPTLHFADCSVCLVDRGAGGPRADLVARLGGKGSRQV